MIVYLQHFQYRRGRLSCRSRKGGTVPDGFQRLPGSGHALMGSWLHHSAFVASRLVVQFANDFTDDSNDLTKCIRLGGREAHNLVQHMVPTGGVLGRGFVPNCFTMRSRLNS